MAEIDEHAFFVHARDEFAPEQTQPGITGFEATVPDKVAQIVSELNDANSETVKQIEAVQRFAERRAVLESVDES